jgi:hypothetical protein
VNTSPTFTPGLLPSAGTTSTRPDGIAFSAVISVPPRGVAACAGLVVTNCSPKLLDGPTTRASSTSTRMPSRDSQKSSADRDGSTGVDSMLPPPRSGAYVSGRVAGVISSGAGSALPCERTIVVGVPISVIDRFEVVDTDSPLLSG